MIDQALIDRLAASQEQVAGALRRPASDHVAESRGGAWSARDVAAHLAATEVECFEPRVRAIAAGNRPRFAFYSNDNRDFSAVRLEDALAQWAVTRARLLDFARSLSQDELTRVGVHSRYGEVTVPRYLGIMLEHDREHLHDLEASANGPAR